MIEELNTKIKLPTQLAESGGGGNATGPAMNRMEMMRSRVKTTLFNPKPSSPSIVSRINEFGSAPLRVLPKSDTNSPNNTEDFSTSPHFDFSTRQFNPNLSSTPKSQSVFATKKEEPNRNADRDPSCLTFPALEKIASLDQKVKELNNSNEKDLAGRINFESDLRTLSSVMSNDSPSRKLASGLKKNPKISLVSAVELDDDDIIEDVTPKVHTIFQQFRPAEEEKLGSEEENIHYITTCFTDFFEELEILGEGTSGTVKRCRSHSDNKDYAVKIVNYRGDDEMKTLIISEFKNLRRLKHKNIVQVLDLYIDETRGKIYTVLELVEGKEMFEIIYQIGSYSEYVASNIFKQILLAIQYMHLNGVCHRDLKPNNILVSEDGSVVKITDFNVSKFTEEDKKSHYTGLSNENYRMWTYTGTIAFTAPEVFTDTEYTESVDMWSAGVVLYTMLSGYQPFQAEYLNDLIELIKKGEVSYEGPVWDKISLEAKDLVRRLLNKNYKERYSPSQALAHPWIQNIGRVSGRKMETTILNLKSNVRKNAKGNFVFDPTNPTDTRTKSESPLKSNFSPFCSPFKSKRIGSIKTEKESILEFPGTDPKRSRKLFEEIEELDETKN